MSGRPALLLMPVKEALAVCSLRTDELAHVELVVSLYLSGIGAGSLLLHGRSGSSRRAIRRRSLIGCRMRARETR
jgi:hypothetical protein